MQSLPVRFDLGKPTVPTYLEHIGWRCLHKNEAPGAYDAPDNGMPEVRPSVNASPIEFTEVMQWVAYRVMSMNNHVITPSRFRNVFGGGRMLTNSQGWDDPRAGLRADFVNNIDTDEPLPKLMKAIINGGMFIPDHPNTIIGDELVCRPGVHGVNTNTMPKKLSDFEGATSEAKRVKMMAYVNALANEIMQKRWYFHAVNWHEKGPRVDHFTQGWDGADYYGPVIIAYFLRDVTPYPIAWFTDWKGSEQPDPLRFYL